MSICSFCFALPGWLGGLGWSVLRTLGQRASDDDSRCCCVRLLRFRFSLLFFSLFLFISLYFSLFLSSSLLLFFSPFASLLLALVTPTSRTALHFSFASGYSAGPRARFAAGLGYYSTSFRRHFGISSTIYRR